MNGKHFTLVFLPRLNGEVIESDIEELNRAIAASDNHLVLMPFGPGKIVQRVLSVEPSSESASGIGIVVEDCGPYHFSAITPWGVSPNMYSLPLPTSPKYDDAATAMRESKKGEYFTP